MASRPLGPKTTIKDKFKYMSDQTGVAGREYREYKNWLFENKELPGMTEIMMQYMFGAVMGQTFPAIYVFEWLLNHYPVEQILEFGTGTGGLSAYLQFQADIRGLDFYTFDAKERLGDPMHGTDTGPANPPVNIKKLVNFRQGNLWDKETQKEVRDILRKKPTLYYTDNGNKPRELKLFAPWTVRGSVVGTHDWTGYFGIEDLFHQLGMKLIFEDICIEGKTKMRFWYKTI